MPSRSARHAFRQQLLSSGDEGVGDFVVPRKESSGSSVTPAEPGTSHGRCKNAAWGLRTADAGCRLTIREKNRVERSGAIIEERTRAAGKVEARGMGTTSSGSSLL